MDKPAAWSGGLVLIKPGPNHPGRAVVSVTEDDSESINDSHHSGMAPQRRVKWHQLDRQPDKHWRCGWRCFDESSAEDLGIELNTGRVPVGLLNCWFRATWPTATPLHPPAHLRTTEEVIILVVALTASPGTPQTTCMAASGQPQRRADPAG